MANKKREYRFHLTDDDFKAFGRYRIMYTDQGRKMVRRQRITYLISAAALVILFTVFKVDQKFTILVYLVAAGLAVAGIFFAEKLVLKQQDEAITKGEGTAERVHADENRVRFDEDSFTAGSGEEEQAFSYKDIKLLDITEEAIYIWMSDTAIMSLPLHAFNDMKEMKEIYKWIKAKTEE